MGFKIYQTDWIMGLDRYNIITTASQLPNSNNYIAEIFIFCMDNELCCHTLKMNYEYTSGDEKYINIDEEFMLREAAAQAKIIIRLKHDTTYRNTQYLYTMKVLNMYEDKSWVTLLAIRTRYEDIYNKLASNSASEELRDYLTACRALTIRIEPHLD